MPCCLSPIHVERIRPLKNKVKVFCIYLELTLKKVSKYLDNRFPLWHGGSMSKTTAEGRDRPMTTMDVEYATFIMSVTLTDRGMTPEQSEALAVLRKKFTCKCGEPLGHRNGVYHCVGCKKSAASSLFFQ
jgi:hypothetical protein